MITSFRYWSNIVSLEIAKHIYLCTSRQLYNLHIIIYIYIYIYSRILPLKEHEKGIRGSTKDKGSAGGLQTQQQRDRPNAFQILAIVKERYTLACTSKLS